jgi:hypothetical protein
MKKEEITFSLVDIHDIEFSNVSFDAKSITEDNPLHFGLSFDMRKHNDDFCIRTEVTFHHEEKIVIRGLVDFIFRTSNTQQLIDLSKALESPQKEALLSMFILCISTMRGIVHTRTLGTLANRYMIPVIPVKELQSQLQNAQVLPKKNQ